jgi:hypothetical protein
MSSSSQPLTVHYTKNTKQQHNYYYEVAEVLQKNIRSMKMAVVWNVATCSLVEIDQCFRKDY